MVADDALERRSSGVESVGVWGVRHHGMGGEVEQENRHSGTVTLSIMAGCSTPPRPLNHSDDHQPEGTYLAVLCNSTSASVVRAPTT